MTRPGRLLIGAVALPLVLTGYVPTAAATAPQVPDGPVATDRTAVTPTTTTVAAEAVPAGMTVDTGTATGTLLAQVTPRETAAFTLVGASWTAASGDITVQVRAESAKGWGEWTDLDTEDGATGDGGSKITSEPYYAGQSTGVELRAVGAAGASIAGLSATLIDSEPVAADTTVSKKAAVAARAAISYLTPPTIISRANWGADESIRTSCSTVYDTTVKAAVIHHTAGSNDYTQAQAASIVRGIYAYHVQSNGWCDIGYNFLVDKYGDVFEGRYGGTELVVHGAHAGSWNTNTMGVSFMMNSDTAQPSDAAMSAAEQLLAWKLGGFYRDPEGTTTLVGAPQPVIFGHGDVMATDCPGTNLHARLQEIRDQVAARINALGKTALYQMWVNAGGDSSGLGSVAHLERSVSGGRVVNFVNGAGYQRPDGTVYWLGSALEALYEQAGGPSGSLGWPTSSDTVSSGVRTATFDGGVLSTSPAGYAKFIMASYSDFLGRPAGSAEIDFQANAMTTGLVDRYGYLKSLATSDEWLTSVVTRMYADTLGRTPDPNGLATWLSWLRSGRFTVAQANAGFYASDEYYASHGGTAQSWVTSLYANILGRTPDPGGLTFWVNYTNNPSYGRQWVAYQFFQSVESRQRRVTRMYEKLLGREPEPGGLAFWTDRVLTTGDIVLAIEVANSTEYWNRAQTRF